MSYALSNKLGETVLSDDLISISENSKYVYKGHLKVRLFKENFCAVNKIYGFKEKRYSISKSDDKISINYLDNNTFDKYKIRKIYILNNNIKGKKDFEATNFKINNCNNSAIDLFRNVKCWQSINNSNISEEFKKLVELSEKNIIKSVWFNTIYNTVEENISEIVDAIASDIMR